MSYGLDCLKRMYKYVEDKNSIRQLEQLLLIVEGECNDKRLPLLELSKLKFKIHKAISKIKNVKKEDIYLASKGKVKTRKDDVCYHVYLCSNPFNQIPFGFFKGDNLYINGFLVLGEWHLGATTSSGADISVYVETF